MHCVDPLEKGLSWQYTLNDKRLKQNLTCADPAAVIHFEKEAHCVLFSQLWRLNLTIYNL